MKIKTIICFILFIIIASVFLSSCGISDSSDNDEKYTYNGGYSSKSENDGYSYKSDKEDSWSKENWDRVTSALQEEIDKSKYDW